MRLLAERYGFHGWNPPDMSDPQSLSDLGGGAINNDGRFVDGHGTAAGEQSAPSTMLYRQSAVNFINTYDGEKPFCLIVALVNPHDVQEFPGRGIRGVSLNPTFARGGYRYDDFKDLPIDLPPNIEDDLTTKPSVHASFRQFLAIGTGHVLTRERQLGYARFYAYLNQQVDAQIMKLLDALDARGLTDDTVILRTSDHGELAMSHGRMRQKFYNAYREALSVPLIVSNPRLFPEPQLDRRARQPDRRAADAGGARGCPRAGAYGFKGRDLSPILATRGVGAGRPALHLRRRRVSGQGRRLHPRHRRARLEVRRLLRPLHRGADGVRDVRPAARPAGDDEPRARVAQHAGLERRARASAPAADRRDGRQRYDPRRDPLAVGGRISAVDRS